MRLHSLLVALLLPAVLGAQTGRSGSTRRAAADSQSAAASRSDSTAPVQPDTAISGAALLTPAARSVLRAAPGGAALTAIAPGTPLRVLARERGWVRVRAEGWLREGELIAADPSLRSSPSAADLRTNPDAFRGQLVRWSVQLLAMQRADPLRKDLAPDEPYLLARGPGTENALLYLAIPPALLESARALSPLTTVIITARVRTGRSDPAGVPLLDLQSIARQ